MSELADMRTRNDQLDGLRGYAALVVVFFHGVYGIDQVLVERVLYQHFSEIGGPYDGMAKAWLTIMNGHTAVVIFFILSGAVLFDSLRREDGSRLGIAARFLVRRFFRIYPTLFVCLLACWIAFYFTGVPRTAGLWQNLLLYDFPTNGATWTLNVEAFGGILILVAFFAYQVLGEAGIIVVGCAFASLYLHPFAGYLIQFKPFIYCFILGMLIPTRLGKSIIRLLPSASWPVLFLGMLFARYTILETITALFVGLIYYRKAGALGDFLSRPVSVFLGSISYSLYLFHGLFMEIIQLWLRAYPIVIAHPVEFGILAAIPTIALTVPLAYWSVRYVEQPSIWLGRQLTRVPSRAVDIEQRTVNT